MKKINKNYLNRYSRQIVLKNVGISGQKKISSSKVFIVGAGGLGYSVGERITIAGTSIGMGAGTTANDVTFTLRNIQDGRFRYAFLLHEDPIYWPKPSDPQTVGIMQTSNIGIGGRITLDNSGDPKGSQSWDPALEGVELPMDPTNY